MPCQETVVDGLSYVKSEVIGVMSADLQHPPEVISDPLREMGLEILMEGKFKNIAEVAYTFGTKGRGKAGLMPDDS